MARIILAHEAPFGIGALEVRPATRTLSRGGVETVVEPRVMQVLVALYRADSGVVTRDELVEACWEGRIVGDDAINRVLSRLRHLEHDVAADSFRVETITRVGYRLVRIGEAPADTVAAPAASRRLIPRRTILTALGAGAAAAVSGGLLWDLKYRDPAPAAARAAMDRGYAAIREITPDQTAVAVAAFREAAELAPGLAEPWGQLALAYQQQLASIGTKDPADDARIESRARAAAGRALAIEPDNADAHVALATLLPGFGRWVDSDSACRATLARYPNHGTLNRLYGILLSDVGRYRAASDRFRRAMAADARWPQGHMRLVTSLWMSGQLDQADAEMERAFAKWPRHYSVWFTRQRMLTYTGRAPAALAMIDDVATRPIGIPEWNWAMTEAETRAVLSRSKADVDMASGLIFEAAHRAAAFAANGVTFHSVTGRVDDAYRLIDAYYFDRGFSVGPHRYSEEQGMYDTHRQRSAFFLLAPDTAPLRSDPRFAPLVRSIGLEDYWRRTGTRSDYAA